MLGGFRLRSGGGCRARGRLGDEGGSFLIEAIVSSLVVLVAGAGILNMMDRGTELNGQQKVIATAGNLAQSEQETLRGFPLATLSNLRRPSTRSVDGVNYQLHSRTDWINDDSGTPNCSTAGATADYMKVTTTVTATAFGNRRPVTLESIIAPPARTFGEDQGSLAVRVSDRAGDPVSGVTLSLTGAATLSDATNANGCVLWGYLDAGGGYTISASSGGFVQPSGNPMIAEAASVIGDQTANVDLTYDKAGAARAAFTTQRTATSAVTSTSPQKAMIAKSSAPFIPRAYTVTGDQLDTGLVLFPFTDPYSIYADSCVSSIPPAEHLGAASVPRGAASSVVTVQIPAANILVSKDGVPRSGIVVKVTSPCGVVYTRETLTDGTVDDPGFPYGTLTVCVSDGVKHAEGSVLNTVYPATNATFDIGASASGGPCP